MTQQDLLRTQCLIDGQWCDADDGTRFAVVDPANGDELATVPKMGGAETLRAIAAAQAALPDWRARTDSERARILRKLFDLMIEHK